MALTFIHRQLGMSWALAQSCGELRHLNQPACHLRMNELSWLGFISLLSETHHLHAVQTQFNLGLEIKLIFLPIYGEDSPQERGGVAWWAMGERSLHCLRWLFSPLQTLRVPPGLQSPIESMTAMFMCNSNAGFSSISAF